MKAGEKGSEAHITVIARGVHLPWNVATDTDGPPRYEVYLRSSDRIIPSFHQPWTVTGRFLNSQPHPPRREPPRPTYVASTYAHEQCFCSETCVSMLSVYVALLIIFVPGYEPVAPNPVPLGTAIVLWFATRTDSLLL